MGYLFYLATVLLAIAGVIIFGQYRKILKLQRRVRDSESPSYRPDSPDKQLQTTESHFKPEDFRTKLISVLAHNSRGAFVNIISLMDFYKKGQVSPEQLDALFSELRSTSENNLSALENTLKWVKTQLNGFSYNPLKVSASDALNRAIQNNISEIERKEISLSVKGGEEGWVLYADPELLGFVLNNLLNNAIKYSYPGGKIECIIGKQQDKQCKMADIQIVDYGMGMDAKTREAIFCHDKTIYTGSEGEKGAGIALLVCKDFIDIQRGMLDILSEEGQGSTFTLSIPGETGNIAEELCNNQSDSFR